MTHTYNITGMTCNGCVAKVKNELLKLDDVTGADVQLATSKATLSMQKHISVTTLQAAVSTGGNYRITEADGGMHHEMEVEETRSWFMIYKPVILVFAYITVISSLIEIMRGSFLWEIWMSNFMAAFFLVFSFFKLLDVKSFAETYSSYDIIAKRWMGWGYVYALIELALGIAYLIKFNPILTNAITFIVMSISVIGVLQSVLNKRNIECACLGAIFKLPMSTITIIEDALMIIMSAGMLAAAL